MRGNRFGNWLLVAFATLAVLAGGMAFAQEQVGGIEGVVADKDGAALPGATVEAVNSGGGTLVSVTDISGVYRFPRLIPSVYKVSAKLDGFVTAEVPDVDLKLGKVLKINFTLQPGKFQDTITVAADTVAIDVTQSATATSISRENLELLPKGRDFSSVVSQAAGASNEPFLSGISVDGASGSENAFIIDGVNTTDAYNGTQGQGMVTDFIDEVQVKSAGYAAEYGGTLGGVINAITKTGGNEFSGFVGAYLTQNSWSGEQRPTGGYESACPTNSDCTITYKKDGVRTLEPGFGLGGPVMRDKLWFYIGYQPALIKTERTPNNKDTRYSIDQTNDYGVANLKGNLGSSFMYKLAFNWSAQVVNGVLPARDGSTPATANLNIDNKYPNKSLSAYLDWVPSSNFLLSARLGDWYTNTETLGVSYEHNLTFSTGNLCTVSGGTICQGNPNWRPTGFSEQATASATLQNRWERKSVAADMSWFFNAAGSHQVKIGGNYDRVTNNQLTGEVGNLFRIYWGNKDPYLGIVKGTYGSVQVRRFLTGGDVTDNQNGFFIQDSWAITKNVTVNYGVRTEQEKVPGYYDRNLHPEFPAYAFSFDYKDKMAPRLGFAWDVMGDQKLKVYGSWGLYFDIMKMDTALESFGGAHWIAYLYPLNTLDWQSLPNGCTQATNDPAINPCPALGTAVTDDLRLPTSPLDGVDPNLKPMESREWQIGTDFQLNPTTVLGARYVDKHLMHTIEDIGYLVCSAPGVCGEQYITGNPGEGLVVENTLPGLPPQGRAVRNYKSLELTYSRRFADNWMLRGQYIYSKLTGNYSGLASSDEFGRTSPNVERYFDGLVYSYDEKGNFVDGPLNTDRPNQVLLNGIYRFNFGTTVGANFSWRQGTPITTNANFNGVYFYPFGRMDQGRTPNINQTDLFITHPFKFGGMGLEVSLNVLNLFDQKTVTRYQVFKWRDDVNNLVAADGTVDDGSTGSDNEWYFRHLVPYDINAAYAALPDQGDPNPLYMKPLAWQAARAIRIGVKLTF